MDIKRIGHKFRAFVMVLVAAFLIFGSVGTPATQAQAAVSYGHNGYHCTKENKKSGIVVIGDSRTCQLWNKKTSGASFVSVWGGHYGYGGSNGQIDTSSQRTTMKKYVNDTVKATGKCKVYIFATVNDFDGGSASAASGPVANLVSLAKTVKGYNKKATVTIVDLVGSKGKSVKNFSSTLKKKVPSGVKILSISGCLAGSNKGYQSDNVHYNSTTLNNIWKKIK